MLKLHIEDDEGQETVVPIIRDEITIGRQEGNTIRLTERNVSRRHARILRQSDRIYVEAIEARYGIYKNGEKIADREEFLEGDVFLIGDYRLTIQPEKSAIMEETPMEGGASEMSSEPTAIKPLSGAPMPSRASEGTEILPAMPAKLVIISSNFAGQEFPLEHREVVIGRSEDCDIIIDHRSVSQRHAKIVRDKGANYQIVDLNSKNGVRISGDKYTSTHLKRGDIVELGHVKFRFVEPGENYIFTPQSIIPDEDDAPFPTASGEKKGNPMVLVGIVGVVVLLLVVVAAVAMSGGDDDKNPDANNTTAVANTTNTDTATKEDPPEVFSNEKISEGIATARDRLNEGDVDKAIGILEGLEYANPSPTDKEAIGKLISKARAERPFQKDFIIVKDNLQNKEFLNALRALKNIPSHSLFAKLLDEDGQRERVIDGVLAMAKSALDSNNKAGAEGPINELLSYDPENEEALALQSKISASRVVSNTSPKNDSSTKKKNTDTKKVEKKKSPPKLSAEETKALEKSALKKVFAGDSNGAISDCKTALRSGSSDCHRIMGIAYKNKGNKSKACSSFKKALKKNPSNTAIQNERDRLGCD